MSKETTPCEQQDIPRGPCSWQAHALAGMGAWRSAKLRRVGVAALLRHFVDTSVDASVKKTLVKVGPTASLKSSLKALIDEMKMYAEPLLKVLPLTTVVLGTGGPEMVERVDEHRVSLATLTGK